MFSSVPNSPQSSLIDQSSSQIRTRLRPFSYLRTYRQNHSHSLNAHGSHHVGAQSEARAGSHPSNYSPQIRAANLPRSHPVERKTLEASPVLPSNPETAGTTSGWLPTVGGQSGVSRIATEPQATATGSSSAVLSNNSALTEIPNLSPTMPQIYPSTSRTTNVMPLDYGEIEHVGPQLPSHTNKSINSSMSHQLPSIRLSAHQDPRALRPSLVFSPMFRILPSGQEVLRVGRYSEKDVQPLQAANIPSSAPIGFKSKVVSRRHCEFWWSRGTWFIKDVKSSSGTFLNHIRLSAPGNESKPFPVRDGDIVQLGIDFKGGEEMIFRCVKIKIELNKGWQAGPTSFNVQSHKHLRELNSLGKISKNGPSQDCSICLGPIAPCQSLFVAPCSHTWHYKCIRVIINGPIWPHFICPNCRNVADLEAETDDSHTDDREETEAIADEEKLLLQPLNTAELSNSGPPHAQMCTKEFGQQALELQAEAREGCTTGEISDDYDGPPVKNAAYRLEKVRTYDSSNFAEHPTNCSSGSAPAIKTVPRRLSNCSATSQPRSTAVPIVQHRARTPSPRISRSHEVIAGTDGPMTPRNNIGPFVFDGSDRNLANATVTSINIGAPADMPLNISGPIHPS